MYEELYEPIPDAAAYLERIGLAGTKLNADRESLDRIIFAHLTHVAFENMDTWGLGIPPAIGINYLFNKIVNNHRGGWCFELNSLFNALLRSLGFETYMVAAHVMAGGEELKPPAHCCIIVTLDGEKYFCDVGYGGPVPFGALKLSGESRFGFHICREGAYTKLYNEVADYVAIQFKDVPADPVEFIPMNFYISQIPTSPFRNELRVNIRYPDGSAALVEGNFKLRRGEEVMDKQVEVEELPALLEKYFYICPDTVAFRPFGPNDN